MLVTSGSHNAHLTYCLNVHPANTVDDVVASLGTYAGPVARSVQTEHGHDGPVAVGLRLGAEAVEELADDCFEVERLAEALLEIDGYALTVNAFPYGRFHDGPVKSDVYRPDWSDRRRVEYTIAVAEILAALPGRSPYRSISTSPGTFKAFGEADVQAIAAHVAEVAARLHILEMETEVWTRLAIEPEPGCLFETTDEMIGFYRDTLLAGTWPALERLKPGLRERQHEILHRYIGVCYDTCHQAVEFEDPAESLRALSGAGVPIVKVQLSSALDLADPAHHPEAVEELRAFDEPTWLHQVVALRRDGGLDRFDDLPAWLEHAVLRDDAAARCHFHVPIFLEAVGRLGTTRRHLERALEVISAEGLCDHLEIETYSWSMMPDRRGAADDRLVIDIAREYAAVFAALA